MSKGRYVGRVDFSAPMILLVGACHLCRPLFMSQLLLITLTQTLTSRMIRADRADVFTVLSSACMSRDEGLMFIVECVVVIDFDSSQ